MTGFTDFEVRFIEREIGRIVKAPIGFDQRPVQAVGEFVGALGTLTVLAVLLAQFLDVGAVEAVGLIWG
ncbi:hypothetical protein ACWDPV_23765 [Gordonia sp. NPDC003504]